MGDLIQFRPRSNQKADRALGINPLEAMAAEIMDQVFPADIQIVQSPPPKDSA